MAEDDSAPLTGANRVDDQQLRGHVDEAVRSSVEETGPQAGIGLRELKARKRPFKSYG